MAPADLSRRLFVRGAVEAGAVAVASAGLAAEGERVVPQDRVRVAVIGCGSVSRSYLEGLEAAPHVDLVATCDRVPERAAQAAERHGVPRHVPSLDALLDGPPFDLLVNLTDMQEHAPINARAVAAGRHVWSEKPLASRYADAKAILDAAVAKGVRILAAPTVVASPQFRFMHEAIRSGTLGVVAAAHASYGHLGPTWSSFFYDRDGGSLFDLGVYNVASLTGLLGPARSVVAMTSIVTRERTITGKGRIEVTAEDNAMLVIEHADGGLSHVQCGFNYFTPRDFNEKNPAHHSIGLVGTKGCMRLAGYDWAPIGVDVATADTGRRFERHATEQGGYLWQSGAERMAAWLLGGEQPAFTAAHAAHVVEIIEAAHRSQATGTRIAIESTFPPLSPGGAGR